MSLQLKAVIFLAFVAVFADECKYSKFSPKHTYCLTRKETCEVLEADVCDEDKELIVKLHNQYREKVATGKEERAGGMPSAANMMQMYWDDELAEIAQKHAEQCVFDHDCDECREVDRFKVGQSLAKTTQSTMTNTTDWTTMFQEFYDEIATFDKSHIKPYIHAEACGHFTQMLWATSWRLGCGRAVYKEGEEYVTLLVCDYGPGGNTDQGEMYKAGSPCSECPSGTCCSLACAKYKGLCRVKNPDTFKN